MSFQAGLKPDFLRKTNPLDLQKHLAISGPVQPVWRPGQRQPMDMPLVTQTDTTMVSNE